MPRDAGSGGGRRRPTIYDVARSAGVSPTTVSHALSGRGRVHPGTRERVLAVASSLGYRTVPSAQHLAAASTGAIGLCLPEAGISLGYYHEVALGAAEQALANGLALTLIPAVAHPSGIAKFAVDAFMVIDPRRDDPLLDVLARLEVPVITGNNGSKAKCSRAGTLETDLHDAFIELLDHMAANGARRFAAVISPPEQAWMAGALATYRAWCRLHGIAARTTRAPFISTIAEARLAARRLLDPRRMPDAIIGVQAQSGPAALSVASERGIRVPEDVLIASFVDPSSFATSWPPLTALDLRPRMFGARLVDLTVRALAGEPSPSGKIKAVLRVRASTRRSASVTGCGGRPDGPIGADLPATSPMARP